MAKLLSISDIEQGGPNDPIWVLNSSADSDVQQSGEIHIGIPKQNGTKIDPLFIPQTWLPLEVTLQVPRAQLLASSEFRQAVNKQLIALISPESAAKILAQDGASEEQARLDELRKHIRQAGAAKTISSSKSEIRMISTVDDDEDEVAEEEDAPKKEKGLSSNFMMFAERLKGMPDVQALNAIRARRKFAVNELKFLVSNLPDKAKTVAAVSKQLAKSAK